MNTTVPLQPLFSTTLAEKPHCLLCALFRREMLHVQNHLFFSRSHPWGKGEEEETNWNRPEVVGLYYGVFFTGDV